MSNINYDDYIEIVPAFIALKKQRIAKGFTQQQVADYSKISTRQYIRFESGEKFLLQASARSVLSICSMLEIDPLRFVCKYEE